MTDPGSQAAVLAESVTQRAARFTLLDALRSLLAPGFRETFYRK